MTEIWKDIEGYNGRYQVSNLGRVRSVDYIEEINNKWGSTTLRKRKGKVLKPCFDGKGNYIHVCLNGRSKNIHRLVAKAFIPNPNQYDEVNHKDEDKTNNKVSNLEWCTHKYNNNYGMKATCSKGSNNGMSKITNDVALEIKEKSKYMRTSDIAKEYSLSESHVSAIKYGRRWGWL